MADEQNKLDPVKLIAGLIGVVVIIWGMGAWFGFW